MTREDQQTYQDALEEHFGSGVFGDSPTDFLRSAAEAVAAVSAACPDKDALGIETAELAVIWYQLLRLNYEVEAAELEREKSWMESLRPYWEKDPTLTAGEAQKLLARDEAAKSETV